jgi:hypothetical protein
MDDQKLLEAKYLKLITDRINVCRSYKPRFGQGHVVSLSEFEGLYGADPFYSWFGLDHPLVYAAHKAAGGITSLYRQIGIGCEQLFRQIIRDTLNLTPEQATWSYVVTSPGRKDRTLSLDGRIQISDLTSDDDKQRVQKWLQETTSTMGIDPSIASVLKGAVFEVRQGYKSKDSKRQNADIGNAGTAYSQGYLPVVTILSTRIDSDVADCYANAGWLLLRGNLSGSPFTSTFAFCSQVLGYDLAGFFQSYSGHLQETVEEVVQALLAPKEEPVSTVSVDPLTIQADELDLAEELEPNDENNEF